MSAPMDCHDASDPRADPFVRFVLQTLEASGTSPTDLRRAVCTDDCIAVAIVSSKLVRSPDARRAERAARAAGWPSSFGIRGLSLDELRDIFEPDSPAMQDVNDYAAGKWPGRLLMLVDSETGLTLMFVHERPAGIA